MSRRWLYFATAVVSVLLVLPAGCQPQQGLGEKPAAPDNSPVEKVLVVAQPGAKTVGSANQSAVKGPDGGGEYVLDPQLEINRTALFEGPSEQIRIKAATVMMFSRQPSARAVLLDALKQSENSSARLAVCKALIQTRTAKQSVTNAADFIRPLFEILKTEEDLAQVRVAAEATLVFEYDQIADEFEKLTTDTSLPSQARLNAAYALRLQPDIRATVKLIKLLDDSDKEVIAASQQALHSLGIPVGKDAATRQQIINQLQRKGKDEFLRDWLVRQERQLRSLEAESALWRRRYLAALGRTYETIADDAARGKFLAEFLVDSKAPVRLWALEKVYQGRVATASKLPAELGPVLISLISDPDRDVRLQTARVLSLMGQLNSSRQLLRQLELEQDQHVRTQFFVALGGACHYAFSPNAEFGIPEEIRKKTLDWAEEFLSSQDPAQAQKGAEVIKKLLEQDGLAAGVVDKFLGLLAERYDRQKAQTAGPDLAAELLNAMATLCAQSTYKTQAARRFEPLFEQALNDESPLLRQAAADGLIYIDKAKALKLLRTALVNDTSPPIRQRLIELAGEVGGSGDLLWLTEKAGATTGSEPAWQAMLKIFRRLDLAVLNEWLDRFGRQDTENRLSDEQRLALLEIAERKAVAENKTEHLGSIRSRLARLYTEDGRFEKAAEYLGMLRESAGTEREKQALRSSLLDVYLKWQKVRLAVQLVENCLLEADLEPNSVIVQTIDRYVTAPPAGAEPNFLLTALSAQLPDDRPLWSEQMKAWTERFTPPGEPNKP